MRHLLLGGVAPLLCFWSPMSTKLFASVLDASSFYYDTLAAFGLLQEERKI